MRGLHSIAKLPDAALNRAILDLRPPQPSTEIRFHDDLLSSIGNTSTSKCITCSMGSVVEFTQRMALTSQRVTSIFSASSCNFESGRTNEMFTASPSGIAFSIANGSRSGTFGESYSRVFHPKLAPSIKLLAKTAHHFISAHGDPVE